MSEELKKKITMLGRKIRAYARWDCIPGYYSSSAESATAYAKSELAEAIAQMIDESFDVDSSIPLHLDAFEGIKWMQDKADEAKK